MLRSNVLSLGLSTGKLIGLTAQVNRIWDTRSWVQTEVLLCYVVTARVCSTDCHCFGVSVIALRCACDWDVCNPRNLLR